MESEII